MAITRAQQAKQMLQDGGRIGFFTGMREQEQKEKTAASTGKGRDPTAQFQDSKPISQDAKTRLEEQRKGAQETLKQQRRDAVIGRGPFTLDDKDLSFVERANRFGAQKFTNTRKNQLRRLIDYIGGGRKFQVPGLFSVYDAVTGGSKLDPSDYLGLEDASPLRLQAMFGEGVVGTMDEEKIRDISKVLGQDVVTQDEFEQFYPNMNPPEGTGRDDMPIDPCLGPNPPAYCFTKDPEDPTPVRNLAGLTPRIGGGTFDFTGMADGGIASLDREAFLLGGIAKGLKKAVRGVKKIAKSPIGKAALGLAAFKFGPAIFGKGSLNPFLRTVAGDTDFSPLGSFLSKYGLVSKAGLPTFKGGIALASILPLLVGKTDEEKDDILKDYYASQELSPATTARQAGSEFDFYNYNLAEGGTPRKEPVAKKVMPLLDMGGMEKDYRAEGGFVPIGRMEKADDVPARLSKNEFVFTADAVRNAGDGDVDKGAEVMYNMMKNLEAGGEVSEESQGLEGAREMFQTSQRLEEVL